MGCGGIVKLIFRKLVLGRRSFIVYFRVLWNGWIVVEREIYVVIESEKFLSSNVCVLLVRIWFIWFLFIFSLVVWRFGVRDFISG